MGVIEDIFSGNTWSTRIGTDYRIDFNIWIMYDIFIGKYD